MRLCDQIEAQKNPEMAPNEVENEPSYVSLGAFLVNASNGLAIFVLATLWFRAGFCRMLRAASPFSLLWKGQEGPSKSTAPEGPSKSTAPEGPSKSKAPEGHSKSTAQEGPSKSKAPEAPSKSKAPEGPSKSTAPEAPSKSPSTSKSPVC